MKWLLKIPTIAFAKPALTAESFNFLNSVPSPEPPCGRRLDGWSRSTARIRSLQRHRRVALGGECLHDFAPTMQLGDLLLSTLPGEGGGLELLKLSADLIEFAA